MALISLRNIVIAIFSVVFTAGFVFLALPCLTIDYTVTTETVYEREEHVVKEIIGTVPEMEVEEMFIEPQVEYTQEELDLLARVVMSEASILSYDAKRAVAECVINRCLSDSFPDTIYEVITQPSQFSTADNGDVTQECYDAALDALYYPTHPTNMVFFRTDYPHDYGTFCIRYGNTYFNTED